ncbi:MAG: hypothetical protein ACRCW9_08910 [Cetobacterium sp.]
MKVTLNNIILKKQNFERADSIGAGDISVAATIGVKISLNDNICEISFDLEAQNENKTEAFKIHTEYFITFTFDIDKSELEKSDQKEINELIFLEAYKKEISKQVKATLTNASLGNVQLPTFKKN